MRPLTRNDILIGLAVVAFGVTALGVTIKQTPSPRWVSIDRPTPELMCWIHTGTRATVCFDLKAD